MMDNIVIRQLKEKELYTIYQTYAGVHFPPDEVKPLSAIKRMTLDGTYLGYGLYEDTEENPLLCYALFTVLPDRENILLDYLAVMEEYRSTGIGSKFLEYMQIKTTDFGGLMIEAEDPDFAPDDLDRNVREKRLSFYFMNQAIDTGIRAFIFGVHYRLLYLPLQTQPNIPNIYNDFHEVYRHMVSEKNYKNQVYIQPL